MMIAVYIFIGASLGLSILVPILALIHADPPEDCPYAQETEMLGDVCRLDITA